MGCAGAARLASPREQGLAVTSSGGSDYGVVCDTTFMSSGSMGVTQSRLTWTLRFDKPGTYIYNCTIHVLAGMGGVINVR